MVFILTFAAFFALSQATGNEEPSANWKFGHGEVLEYRLGYGWFTVGRASVQVDSVLHDFRDKQCVKMDIKGRSAGLLGFFTHVEDSWGAYVSTEDMLPVMAYADIEEGKYTRNERIFFDQETGEIRVEMTKKGQKRPTRYYDYGPEIHDLISGYMYLRNIEFSNLNVGDTVSFRAFYDEIYYEFHVIYEAREMIETEVGDLLAYRLAPLLPENDIFPGERPITVWVSADANQLPLKVEARMFFGTAYSELTSYKNIRFGPDFN